MRKNPHLDDNSISVLVHLADAEKAARYNIGRRYRPVFSRAVIEPDGRDWYRLDDMTFLEERYRGYRFWVIRRLTKRGLIERKLSDLYRLTDEGRKCL